MEINLEFKRYIMYYKILSDFFRKQNYYLKGKNKNYISL